MTLARAGSRARRSSAPNARAASSLSYVLHGHRRRDHARRQRRARSPLDQPPPAADRDARTGTSRSRARPAERRRRSAARQRISPTGAPYSYTLPHGFVDGAGAQVKRVRAGGTFETAVTPTGAAAATSSRCRCTDSGADSDPFSYDQLQAEIDRLARQRDHQAGHGGPGRVAGKRALRYLFDYGTTKVINYFVFIGTTEVQVRCQWTSAQPAIESGCDEVVSSLKCASRRRSHADGLPAPPTHHSAQARRAAARPRLVSR